MKTLRELTPARHALSWETIGQIHDAIETTAERIAAEMEPDTDPDMVNTCNTVAALRQPISLAAAYRDICTLLDIPVPRVVLEAIV